MMTVGYNVASLSLKLDILAVVKALRTLDKTLEVSGVCKRCVVHYNRYGRSSMSNVNVNHSRLPDILPHIHGPML